MEQVAILIEPHAELTPKSLFISNPDVTITKDFARFVPFPRKRGCNPRHSEIQRRHSYPGIA
jgi:hypothetical protein